MFCSAIHVAVIHDQLEALTSLVDVVETLPESCKILDTTNKQQQTALHIACLTDNFEALTVSVSVPSFRFKIVFAIAFVFIKTSFDFLYPFHLFRNNDYAFALVL